jgi:hypothetical protein
MRNTRCSSRVAAVLVSYGCLTSLAAGGCATMVHSPIADEAADTADRGVRYYRVSPYLIAYSNGKGGVVTEIKFLPDPTKKMSVRPDSTLADVGSTLTFENGALTESNDSGDATGVAKAVSEAVTKFGTALIGAGNVPDRAGKAENEAQVPAPYIYKIVVKNGTVELIGGNRPEPFQITLLPQPPPKKEKE